MASDSNPTGQDAAAALAGRLRHDVVGALELFTVYLGERLGLYRALAEDGPATSSELAGRTGTAERYVREWLEHHAASGLLEVDDPAAGPLDRRYRLLPAHVPVLADPDSVCYRAFSGIEIVRAGRWLPQLVEAFRTGDAPPPLPWAPEGRAEYNRAVFLNLLGSQWLPAVPQVHRRLRRPPPARVADLACGAGWSTIAMARAYPLIRVDGFDLDADVIAAARRNAAQARVSGRVAFAVTDASGLDMTGRYDLVTIFEGLHDMSRPVDALGAARGMLGQAGSVIIADELVEDEFTAPPPNWSATTMAGAWCRACPPPWSTLTHRPPGGDAPGHVAPVRPAGGLCQRGSSPYRNRNLALLPADPMIPGQRSPTRSQRRPRNLATQR